MHTHAQSPSNSTAPFASATKRSAMCSRGSSRLVPGALPTAAPFLRKRAELHHPPILDKEQMSNSPLLSKVISQGQKSKKQEQKVQHFVMKFCGRGEKILSSPSLPSLSNQAKYHQDTWDKVNFPCFCLELFVFSSSFWW